MKTVKTLIHLHTDYSGDAKSSLGDVISTCHSLGIGCVAVTDHNTIRGARALAAAADFSVIVGEEISTREGHLLGLFLKHEIPPGLPAVETARRIHDQGGLVMAPHPFSSLCKYSLRAATEMLIGHLDAVEVSNAQSLCARDDRLASEFAARHGLPGFVGSDSHLPCSIAPCHQFLEPFDGPEAFLAGLRRATLCPGRHPLRYFVEYGWRSEVQRWLGRPPLGFGANAAPRAQTARPVAQPAT